ncbi:hypothetical protein PAAG_12312 [Paracoccidioides lutzii Pb01]|uniref:Uncharacterized protein n=1 Tax=Paracoccidioides lutzii (strain ATCC MYA-826 / Pb01) TaxID=502779 RepID=A0A0A2V0G9_PARBA|nr:hypothetical protein PAAG_12312 [Paracoccidioides lutzii Pb01]KGQ01003.1 hypothetical protein PAAG_12312 [Paracoccidioides lutzii Pb01]
MRMKYQGTIQVKTNAPRPRIQNLTIPDVLKSGMSTSNLLELLGPLFSFASYESNSISARSLVELDWRNILILHRIPQPHRCSKTCIAGFLAYGNSCHYKPDLKLLRTAKSTLTIEGCEPSLTPSVDKTPNLLGVLMTT